MVTRPLGKTERDICDDLVRYGEILQCNDKIDHGHCIREYYIVDEDGDTWHIVKYDGVWIHLDIDFRI